MINLVLESPSDTELGKAKVPTCQNKLSAADYRWNIMACIRRHLQEETCEQYQSLRKTEG
uniref:Uncharacterized protein n=1 Tax=Oryza glaberrima TaxID=4538 RepID=A0A679BCC4_ORYGL|nr:hypothetical protein [Oryza glaberrima]